MKSRKLSWLLPLFAVGLAACSFANAAETQTTAANITAQPEIIAPSPTAPVTAQAQSEAKVITVETVGAVDRLVTLAAHTDKVTDVAFSGDGAYLASSGLDGKIRLWDTRSWQEVNTFAINLSDLNVIDFSPDGKLLASSEAIRDVQTGQVAQQLKSMSEVGHVAFSPDGSLLAMATFPAEITLWDVNSGQVVRTFEKQLDVMGYFGVVFSPDGKQIAAGSPGKGMVTLWDVDTGKINTTFTHGNETGIHDVAFSPDGRLLASGGTDYLANIWDVASGKPVQKLVIGDGIYSLAFSPDGKILATAGCDRTLKLWEVESGKMLRSLPHSDELMTVAFSPDGALLAVGGYDKTVVIWGIK